MNTAIAKKKYFVICFILVFALIFAITSSAQVSFIHNYEIATEFPNYANTAAWGDIDNDGDLDVYVVIGAKVGHDLMLNDLEESGAFTRADTSMAHRAKTAGPRSALLADIDNDGDLDILTVGQDDQIWLILNKLAETDSLWFEDVSEATGIAHLEEAYYFASMADYDNNGKLDILVTGLAKDGWYPTLLFRNTTQEGGPVSFEETADEAGVLSLLGMNIMAGIWADYDDDGDQDLFVAPGDDYPVFLYRNEGDGTFTDVTIEAGFGDSFGNCRAAIWGDYDNDGDLDIFIGRRTYDETPDMDICQFFRNDGDVFTEIESARIQGKVIYGVAAGDYDNDGDLDLHLLDSQSVDLMLRNDGDFAFTDVTAEVNLVKAASPGGWGEMDIGDRGGQTWADWDADGDLDLMLPGESGKIPYMMRNDGGNANNWLEVKLTGVQSNRSAVGTRLTAISGNLVQAREVCMGTGYVAGPPADVHFGFGQRTVIDSLIIKWPAGTVDVLTDVNVNQILTIEEGSAISDVETASTEIPAEFMLSQNYPNPFNPRTTIQYELVEPGKVRLDVYSTLGQRVMTLVEAHQSSGTHTVSVNANHLAAGVYMYRLKVDDFEMQKKMILIK